MWHWVMAGLVATLVAGTSAAHDKRATPFETVASVAARDVLPAALFSGGNYRIADEAALDGDALVFDVSSDFGAFRITGAALLRKRIQEFQAIAALQRIKRLEAFTRATESAAFGAFRGAQQLITKPAATADGVSDQLSKEAADADPNRSRKLASFHAGKRRLSYILGVDAYSLNQPLQRELNSVAWADFAGNLVLRGATSAGAAEASPKNRIAVLLRDYPRSQLAALNRQTLLAAGVGEVAVEQFLAHRHFPPERQTYLADAVAGLSNVPGAAGILGLAVRAEDPFQAFATRRTAELYRAYHERIAPLRRIVTGDAAAYAVTGDGVFLLASGADYVAWTARIARLFVKATERAGGDVKGREFWAAGRLSVRARRELETRGWRVHERAAAELGIE